MGLGRRLDALERALGADGCAECGGPPKIVMADASAPTTDEARCGVYGRPVRVVSFTLDFARPHDDWQVPDDP